MQPMFYSNLCNWDLKTKLFSFLDYKILCSFEIIIFSSKRRKFRFCPFFWCLPSGKITWGKKEPLIEHCSWRTWSVSWGREFAMFLFSSTQGNFSGYLTCGSLICSYKTVYSLDGSSLFMVHTISSFCCFTLRLLLCSY